MAFNIFATATSDIPLSNLDANFTMIGSSAAASTLYPTATTSITYGGSGTEHIFSGGKITGPLNGTVGATTPAAGTFNALTVSSTQGTQTITSTTAAQASFLLLRNTADSSNSYVYVPNKQIGIVQADTSGSSVVYFSTQNIERMRIDSSGNVGIGTSSPNVKLEVAGPDTAAGAGIRLSRAADTTNFWDIFRDGTTGILNFKQYGAAASAMVIDTSGNVGIGTAAPVAKLGLVGGTSNASSLATAYSLAAFNITPKSTSGYSLQFGSGPGDFPYIQMSAGGLASGDITIQPYGGNVGIGTTSPGSQLQIGATNTIAGIFEYTFSGNGVCSNNTYASAGGRNDIYFMRAGNNVGRIETSLTATAYYTTSDYRLKNNIFPMTGALDKVLQLKPVTYKWETDNSSGQGFIAHELQSVVPDCVSGEKDATREEEYEVTPAVPAVVDEDGVETTPAVEAVKATRTVPSYQGVDTSFLVATLTAAIQELKAIIDTQATRIAALEAKA